MLNMIRMDLRRLFKSRSFYVCFLLIPVFLAVLTAGIYKLSQLDLNAPTSVAQEQFTSGFHIGINTDKAEQLQKERESDSDAPLPMPADFNKMSQDLSLFFHYNAQGVFSFVVLISIIFLTLFISSELSSGFGKNILHSQASRVSLALSKAVTSLVTLLIYLLAFLLILYFYGYLLTGDYSLKLEREFFKDLALRILLAWALCTFYVFLAYLTRSKVVGIILILLSTSDLLPSLLQVLENLFKLEPGAISHWSLSILTQQGTLADMSSLRIIFFAIAALIVYNGLTVLRLSRMDIH